MTAVTVPMNYSGDPRCAEAEEVAAAAVFFVAAAAAAAIASESVDESIHFDLRFH